jgi:hypothetical protein
MIKPEWWCEVVDLADESCIHVYPGGCYWALYERRWDREVSFLPADGDAIARLFGAVVADTTVETEPLTHRFVDTDSKEKSAFVTRRTPDGITISFIDCLEDEDDPTSLNAGGTSLRLSRSDAEKLLNRFKEQLQIMHGQL